MKSSGSSSSISFSNSVASSNVSGGVTSLSSRVLFPAMHCQCSSPSSPKRAAIPSGGNSQNSRSRRMPSRRKVRWKAGLGSRADMGSACRSSGGRREEWAGRSGHCEQQGEAGRRRRCRFSRSAPARRSCPRSVCAVFWKAAAGKPLPIQGANAVARRLDARRSAAPRIGAARRPAIRSCSGERYRTSSPGQRASPWLEVIPSRMPARRAARVNWTMRAGFSLSSTMATAWSRSRRLVPQRCLQIKTGNVNGGEHG